MTVTVATRSNLRLARVSSCIEAAYKLKNATRFDLDESKPDPDTGEWIPGDNRARHSSRRSRAGGRDLSTSSLGWHCRSDRNRVDLDWKAGSFTWRYRNKLTLERTFSIRSHHFIPYVAAEPFYESQYKKWSTTDLYVGCLLPVASTSIHPYYEFENDTGKSPNRQQYYVGLALYFYFSTKSK